MALGEDLLGFRRFEQGICKTLGGFGRGFVRIWEKIHEDLQDFGRLGRRFTRIHENLGDWDRILEDWQDFGRYGRGFMRI